MSIFLYLGKYLFSYPYPQALGDTYKVLEMEKWKVSSKEIAVFTLMENKAKVSQKQMFKN